MADTLIERITGVPADVAAPIAVNLVISDQTLLGDDSAPAVIDGYGPIPAAVARNVVSRALADQQSGATLRRLYARPTTGALVALESRSRRFPPGLAQFIGLRDQTCRTPYCDAPIRHHDHATDHAYGGPTSAVNGLGECAACNYAKQTAGWQVSTNQDETGSHTAHFRTPTGAIHHSHAPPPPGRPSPPRPAIDRGWRRNAA